MPLKRRISGAAGREKLPYSIPDPQIIGKNDKKANKIIQFVNDMHKKAGFRVNSLDSRQRNNYTNLACMRMHIIFVRAIKNKETR